MADQFQGVNHIQSRDVVLYQHCFECLLVDAKEQINGLFLVTWLVISYRELLLDKLSGYLNG